MTVEVGSTSHAGLTVALEYSGTADPDRDYTAGPDAVEIAAGADRASVTLDVFRDFDAEGDETITVRLGTITGNAQAGADSSITLTITDGPAAEVDKTGGDPVADPAAVLPVSFRVSETAVDFSAAVIIPEDLKDPPTQVLAEYSSDPNFETDINPFGRVDLSDVPADATNFSSHDFSLPLSRLVSNGSYYVRVHFGDRMSDAEEYFDLLTTFRFSFATDARGRVVTRCRDPASPSGAGSDPLFAEQWHLENTGQTAFSRSAGVAGADLQMNDAIDNNRNGRGVRLAVVDTGLEICHPDLAANVEPGRSYNFGYALRAGALPTDPFNMDLTGDHGTSVAGVAAAAASNGVGGRGVAPGVWLRAFNPGGSLGDQFDVELLQSLGGSDSNPDSASADIFNMSFGFEIPSGNSEEDFVRLVRMGTSDLRSGRGALYVKAAGNEFGLCAPHPLNEEIGCLGSNADPDNNLPYLLAVGGFNADDVRSSYSSAGANLWIVAPAGEDGIDAPAMITTDQHGTERGFSGEYDSEELPLAPGHALNPNGDYISIFGGTSSAAPAAAGAIAVLLGVYPDLTWRDVKHILASTARRIDPERAQVRAAFNGAPYVAQPAWQTNAAGYGFHNWYGFGALTLDEAVAFAADHAPNSLGVFRESDWFPPGAAQELNLAIPDGDGQGVTHTLTVADLPDAANIEAVIVELDIEHSYGSDLGVTVTSPGGTSSVVNAPFNALLDDFPGMSDWQLLSNAFYGEAPNGEWTIRVVDLAAGDTGILQSWRLRLYYGEHPESS
ncbi:MAG: S8 family serine peptidase [Gammaproteobacteria bacterium]|nr:S8 family serine peptidase [Gammaproteobacteria bacterium]